MQCKLCKKETKLLKKSHIIPDFMYKGLFGKNHQITDINLLNKNENVNRPTGYYEKDILCGNCDSVILNQYESYASKFFFQKSESAKYKLSIKQEHGPDGLRTYHIENVDYIKFKLFLLSILWKSSFSKLHFFKNVELGKYEELIRIMLLNGNAGNNNEFETCLVSAELSKNIPSNSIIAPRKIKENGNTSYVFYCKGYFFHFNISEINKMPIFEKASIRTDNTMVIPIIHGVFATDYFDKYVGGKIRLKK